MFKDKIREHYKELTPGFRKLADYIMENTLDVAFLTATRLSKRVGVDPATVVRFSQEIGYSGYRELSIEIKKYVRDQVTDTYRPVEASATNEELLRSLIDNSTRNFQHFITTDLDSIATAVEILKNADKIYLVAADTSYDLANFMAKKLQSLGIAAQSFYPSMAETASNVSRMKEGEALLAITIEGPSIDTGYAVKMANNKGIHTICITGSGVALPAREAELAIIVPTKSPTNVRSFGAETLILALLWEALANEMKEETADRHKERSEQMANLLKLRAETPEYEVSAPQDLWGNQLLPDQK